MKAWHFLTEIDPVMMPGAFWTLVVMLLSRRVLKICFVSFRSSLHSGENGALFQSSWSGISFYFVALKHSLFHAETFFLLGASFSLAFFCFSVRDMLFSV